MTDIPSESPFDLGQLERLGIRVLTAECTALAQHEWKNQQKADARRAARRERAAALSQESPAMAGAMKGLQKMEREQPREPDRSELLVRVCEQIEQRTDSINPAEFSLSNALQLPEIAQIDPQFRRRVAEDLVGLVIVIASEALERKIRNEKPSEAEDIVADVIANPDIDDDEAYAIHSAAREIERALRAVLMQPPSDTTPPSA